MNFKYITYINKKMCRIEKKPFIGLDNMEMYITTNNEIEFTNNLIDEFIEEDNSPLHVLKVSLCLFIFYIMIFTYMDTISKALF